MVHVDVRHDRITLFSVHMKSEDDFNLTEEILHISIEAGALHVTQIWLDAQHVSKSALKKKKKTGESVGSLCNT